ncbi:MAG: chitinase [Gammaproteobacteria bacterium]|nr:MAG: chitinase [Gammaproteobacteria bacterium]
MENKSFFQTKQKDASKILLGYWHNWFSQNDGYQQGSAAAIQLKDIPKQYNLIAVAFMKASNENPIPQFKPYTGTDQDFKQQVAQLNQQNQKVIISLGGGNAHIALSKEHEEAFTQQLIDTCEKYLFSGIDLDLEGASITLADNQIVIPNAFNAVKKYYTEKGIDFIITMAPEFPYLRENGAYIPYLNSIDYDLIAPQYYNQGGDGVSVGDKWYAQNDNQNKKEFLFYLTESLVQGTRGFYRIPHDKFAISLPSNPDAASNGYVEDPDDLILAFNKFEQNSIPIKGLMTWSINWDDGKTKDGEAYNWQFLKNYESLITNSHDSNNNSTDEKKPEVVPNGQYAEWKVNYGYQRSDKISFNGKVYQCLITHKSQLDWTPDVAVSLWKIIA